MAGRNSPEPFLVLTRDFDAPRHDVADLARDALQDRRVDAVIRGSEQRFAADLEQDPLERLTGLRVGHALPPRCRVVLS